MIRKFLCLGLLFALVACGVDGEPVPPAKPGLTVSGSVKMGTGGSL